jgi:hypothetical protein
MWPTIDRARRRLRGDSASARPSSRQGGPASEDIVVTLGVAELDRLQAALQLLLGDAVARPDTPARLEHALELLLAQRCDAGKSRVVRRPAGLSTPESWEIHLEGVDQATGATIRDAAHKGSFA